MKTIILFLLYFFISCSSASVYHLEESSAPSKEKSMDGTVVSDHSSGKDKSDSKKSPPKNIPKPEKDEEYSEKPSKLDSQNGGGLKAGYADDNKQFNYFINFLEKYKYANHIPLNVSERIIFKVKDNDHKPIANANVKIYARNSLQSNECQPTPSKCKLLEQGKSYSDGSYLFFPSDVSSEFYTIYLEYNNAQKAFNFDRKGNRVIDIHLDTKHEENIPMDIVFVLDTTGSMSKEIKSLLATIELIHLNLNSLGGSIQFGMVLYRDKNEEYITKVIPLTSDIQAFKEELSKVDANGGGDYPEDLQSALRDSIQKINWRKNSVKLNFVITDAPPHLDYGQDFNYITAAKEAKKNGIKFYTIGTGGLDINGEYVLRQISQYTYSKYIFLTYGEKGESDGGKQGSVSHHTGENFSVDKLESIVINFAKEEYFHASGRKMEAAQPYFTGNKIDTENKEDTLQKLFTQSINQLLDFSSIKIVPRTTVGVLPSTVEQENNVKLSEYFGNHLMISISRNSTFQLVERRDLQSIYKEWKMIQLTGTDDAKAVKIGQTIGAKLLLLSQLYKKDKNYEMYLKLLNTETGEVLSITKLVIDKKLGI